MTLAAHPALEKFVAQLGDEMTFAQIVIRRVGVGFELRHIADRNAAPESLQLVPLSGLRALAQSTREGVFRPLKSAPNLSSGWRAVVVGNADLETAIGHIYPGAIVDWFAAQEENVPVTHYREFTERQSGMYRITTMLDDDQASATIRACCHRQFCLKRRLWSVEGLVPDSSDEKSAIPCLEPCAVLMEFARKAARLEQEEKVQAAFAPGDLEAIQAALAFSSLHSPTVEREADFSSPSNPRRLQLALEKVNRLLAQAKLPEGSDSAH